jgi:hypothetical protein
VAAAEPLGDALALKIQELRGRQRDPRPLLRVDNRAEAAEAPFQFDTVNARLHRRDCRAIPESSRTALYGLWSIPPRARGYACTSCRPRDDGDGDEQRMNKDGMTDYVFGVLSVLDQFGGVIRERGREFRDSEEGQQLKAGLDGFYRGLEERERATLEVVLSSLDGLLGTIADLEQSLDAGDRQNGHGPASRNGDGGHP